MPVQAWERKFKNPPPQPNPLAIPDPSPPGPHSTGSQGPGERALVSRDAQGLIKSQSDKSLS